MDILTLLALAVALAMDAFAVALGTSLALPRLTGRHLFRLGWHFGLFQALMPIAGWLAGLTVHRWIVAIDHWIAFGLLLFIGGRMIREAIAGEEERSDADPTRGWSLVLLSVATSIDALAVGLTLAMLGVSIWFPALIIGLVAGGLTLCGMVLGRRIGAAWGPRVEIAGGVILIAIGLKILVEHLTA
ncbi:MAG: manganese efflux pump MntP family protein [Geothermobacteraceae bacterium]